MVARAPIPKRETDPDKTTTAAMSRDVDQQNYLRRLQTELDALQTQARVLIRVSYRG